MCSPAICSKCKQLFQNSESFDNHSCVTKALSLSQTNPKKFLTQLYKSGGCSKKYYDTEVEKLSKKAKQPK